MSDGYDNIDDDQVVADTGELLEPEPEGMLVFGSVDEFVREQLSMTYRRVVRPSGRSTRRWAAD